MSAQRPVNTRVRSLFIENMSGPVLQKLGAYYNIEPFFFSSSLSWTPSCFQEEVQPGRGDREFISGLCPSTLAQRLRADITINLTFLKTMDYEIPVVASNPTSSTRNEDTPTRKRVINTQTPLVLRSRLSGKGCALVLDLLAVHLIRNVKGNTLISYHTSGCKATSAPFLQERMHYAGQSVYWQNIFQRSPDPTFVLLIFIWVAICAWYEALEALYACICWLETYALDTSDIFITPELHIIWAIVFILDTPNPAMDSPPQEEKQFSRTLLEKECRNLLSEIHRLEMSRRMQDQRLKNALNLVFSTTSINNGKCMKKLTEVAVRDSMAMKQIAYLTMTFLPSSFVAAIFGMNVGEISPGTNKTLPHYFAIAAVLTLLTVWIIMTFQSKCLFDSGSTFWMRLVWPWMLSKRVFMKWEIGKEKEGPIPLGSLYNIFGTAILSFVDVTTYTFIWIENKADVRTQKTTV
ncbi:hypothetical protein ARMSODRAFT_1023661 [Armillaria solidipes]|uniref:Cora-domain-containing protein n=1 Tax=Armillaria solidipes TaxID=1076256 RepID=A0A2H3B9R9_9AGAR|nr:hypothetical protein ARMSODRAFT_1023661 [Armillaria solidipes]